MTKQKKKILFDILLLALWAILMVYSLTGAYWHEILGLTLFVLTTAHLLINRRWLCAVTRRIFKTKFSITTVNYIVDALLLIFTLFTMASGVLVSIALFPLLASGNIELWVFLHGWSAYLSMVLVSVHIGLHLKAIAAHLRLNRLRGPFRALYHLIAAGLVTYGLLASVRYPYPVYQNTQPDDASAASITGTAVMEAESPSAIASYALEPSSCEFEQDDLNSTTEGGKGGRNRRNGRKGDDTTIEGPIIQYDSSEVPTLERFLSNLICTGCRKRCSLLSPQCSIGQRQAGVAITGYYDHYGDSGTDDNNIEQSIMVDLNENGFVDVFSVMGMYAAGTFYVGSFASKKKQR